MGLCSIVNEFILRLKANFLAPGKRDEESQEADKVDMVSTMKDVPTDPSGGELTKDGKTWDQCGRARRKYIALEKVKQLDEERGESDKPGITVNTIIFPTEAHPLHNCQSPPCF